MVLFGPREWSLPTQRFVISHPFARKNAKGWGTELVAIEAGRIQVGKAFGYCVSDGG